MSITFKGGAASASSTTAGTSKTITYSPTAGNTLVVYGAGVGVDVSSVTDNATGGSSVYSRLAGPSTNTVTGSIFGTAPGGVKSGVTTITINFASSTRNACACAEYTGVNAYGNKTDSATGSSASPGAAVTLQDPHNFVVCGMSREGTSTWSTRSGVGTLRESLAGGGSTTPGVGIADNTSASTGSLTAGATISSSGAWCASAIELRSVAPIAATIAGHATSSGTLEGSGALAGSAAGHSTDTGTLIGSGKLSASTSGQASVSGTGKATIAAACSIVGHATLSAAIHGSSALHSSTTGHASISGTLAGSDRMGASVIGHATVTGTLSSSGRLVAASTGHANCSGLPSGAGILWSASAGHASVSGTLDAAGVSMTANIRGYTNISAHLLDPRQPNLSQLASNMIAFMLGAMSR